MKTNSYNPSAIELEFAQAIVELSTEIQSRLKSNKILKIENRIKEDNPTIEFVLEDQEGDKHEVVIKIIQRIDK